MIAGSHSKSGFSFARNCQPIFQNGCVSLRSHQQQASSWCPHPHRHSVWSVLGFWPLWYMYALPTIALVCVSRWLMMGNIFHMLVFHLHIIFIYLWQGVYGSLLTYILLLLFGLFVCLLLSSTSSLYILKNRLLSDMSFANIFTVFWVVFLFSWQHCSQSRKI